MIKTCTGCIVDIETLSPIKTGNHAPVITEIAALPFTISGNIVQYTDPFSVLIDVPSQIAKGLHVSEDTLNWYRKVANRDPMTIINQSGVDLGDAVDNFLGWSRKVLDARAKVYAWGSDFDAPIIQKSYINYTGDTNLTDNFFPWRYANYRCARTAFYELTEELVKPSAKPHFAEKDVFIELEDLVLAWNYRRTNKLTLQKV